MKRLRGGRFNFGYQYQNGARGKFSHFRGFRKYFGFMSKYFPFNQGSKRGGRRGGRGQGGQTANNSVFKEKKEK